MWRVVTSVVMIGGLAWCLGACHGAAQDALRAPCESEDADQDEEASVKKTLQPKPALSFEAGPSLTPADALRAWFEANPEAYVRLPVAIERGELGARDSVRVGVETRDDALALSLDDTTLGIPLSARLESLCDDTNPCVVWLEGVWGSAIDLGEFASPGPPWPFTVRDVEAFTHDTTDATVLYVVGE